MVDTKVEGYLLAAMALIPTGISIIMSAIGPTAFNQQLLGFGLVAVGMVAVALRGNAKETNVQTYVSKKIEEYDQAP